MAEEKEGGGKEDDSSGKPRSVKHVYKTKTKGGGYVEGPGEVFSKFFGWIFKIVLVLAIVGIAAFSYAQISSGSAEATTKDISLVIDKNLDNSWFSSLYDSVFNPAKTRTYRSIVEENKDNRNLGVKITSFEAVPREFIVSDGKLPHISATAMVQASSLSQEESQVKFECELEDYTGEIAVSPKTFNYSGNGRIESEMVFCNPSVDGSLSLNPTKLNTKRLTFKVLFETKTIAHYDAYIMRAHDYNSFFYNTGVDPWMHFLGERPANLGFGNVMASTTTAGPINLGMGAGRNQPFLDGYTSLVPFQVSLTKNWRGDLISVKDIFLKLPPEIELDVNPIFCDFEPTGEFEGEYQIYHLTPYALNEKVNKDCSPEALQGTGLTEESCMKYFKTDLKLKCHLNILPFIDEQSSFYLTPIEAEVDYVFAMEDSINLKFFKADVPAGDPCSYYNETKCIPMKGCKPVYEGEVFSKCEQCGGSCTTDYSSEKECNDDYCLVGNCKYLDGSCITDVPY
ncbi:hypothetical protein K8R33_03625 [archaeon]|nr:hypothetical protein [archaeon]